MFIIFDDEIINLNHVMKIQRLEVFDSHIIEFAFLGGNVHSFHFSEKGEMEVIYSQIVKFIKKNTCNIIIGKKE